MPTLTSDPIMVLADKLTANLGTENGALAMKIMQRINQEASAAFILATHDPRLVAYVRRMMKPRDATLGNNNKKRP